MRRHAALGVLAAVLLAGRGTAVAQDYRMPATVEQWDLFYPTAYVDHAGVDWNCGDRRYDGHQGSDFGAGGFAGMDEGRDIVAAAAGTVDYVNDGEYDRCTSGCSGYGNNVRILHADGKTTRYAHMKQWSITVAEGDEVECGQVIGQMGSSGNSTGPHLHFEVRATDGTAHDPFWGDCSSPPSYWVDQFLYDELPLPYCDAALPACSPLDLLTCGDVASGRNDDAGSDEAHLFYGCTEFAYSGPELAWSFVTDRDEPVTVTLSGLEADLDLYVLGSAACAGDDCIAASSSTAVEDEEVVFDASSGVRYTIVIDGFERAVSAFSLAISCAGSLPEVDAGPPPTADAGTTPSPDAGEGGGSGDDELAGGCGCRVAGSQSRRGTLLFAWCAAVGWLAAGRRRRRLPPQKKYAKPTLKST